MPRVYLSNESKLMERLVEWVYGQMRIRGMSQNDLSLEMGITQQAVSMKFKRRRFSYSDFLKMVELFEPDADRLQWLLGQK